MNVGAVIILIIVGAVALAIIGALLFLVHLIILDNNPNYEYYATKGKIIKVTYGDSSVNFLYKKNNVFGLPFFWSLERTSESYEGAKEEMDRQLRKISDRRVIKKQRVK